MNTAYRNLITHRSTREWKDGYRDSQKYKNRLEHYNEYCYIRKIIELFNDKNFLEVKKTLNSSFQRGNESFVHLIADDKWALFADKEDRQFDILYYVINYISIHGSQIINNNNRLKHRDLLSTRSSCTSEDGYYDSEKYINRLLHYDDYLLIQKMKSYMSDHQYNEAARILFQYKSISGYNQKKIESKIFEHMKKVNAIRVNVLGSAAAGKSTLITMIKQLVINKNAKNFDGDLLPINKKTNLATDGIEVSVIDDEFAFWDFGGQEVLYSTHQFFLCEEAQYILVVDLSKLNNKNEQYINDTKYWINQIKLWTITQYSPPVILVGTHSDLIKSKILLHERKIEIAVNLLKLLATSEHLNYKSIIRITTSKPDPHLISSILAEIRSNAHNYIYINRGIVNGNQKILPKIGGGLSFTIIRLRIEEEKKKDKKYMIWDQYIRLFDEFNINNESEIKGITQSLVNFGVVVLYRLYNSGGGSLVIIDPVWLAIAFTSIISITFQSSTLRRGIFEERNLHENWRNKSIDKSVWPDLLKLFETLCLIVKRPNNQYYVPAMLRTPHLSVKTDDCDDENKRNKFITDNLKEHHYQTITRSYSFSPHLPFGLIDRLVVRFMQYPDMDVRDCTWIDDYFLSSSSSNYHLRIQRITVNNKDKFNNNGIKIQLFYPSSSSSSDDNNSNISPFFVHFVFQSPAVILQSYPIPYSITNVELDNIKMNEENIIHQITNNNLLFINDDHHHHHPPKKLSLSSSIPDLLLFGINRFDSSNYVIEKRIGNGGFGTIWLATNLSPSPSPSPKVVFKELKNMVMKNKEFITEVLMMNELKASKYILQLLGITKTHQNIIPNHLKNEIKLNINTLMMVIEYAPFGDLCSCLHSLDNDLKSKFTIKLKLKIALNIASALHHIHNSKYNFIHRDVRSQNIFIFSLNDDYDDNSNIIDRDDQKDYTVNAKLGDLGCMVVGNPRFSQEIGNYQYAAPETMNGSLEVPYSQNIDVYSFAIVLWELFSEKHPFYELQHYNNNIHLDPGAEYKTPHLEINSGERPSLNDLLIENARELSICSYDVETVCFLKDSISSLLQMCWNQDPELRPSFTQIIQSIQDLIIKFK